ncbi:Nif11-like leader peptide family natural product precursor [Azospira inquinata]|uniref:Nif11-like leader peptide family natural product n=1 Tax=Azospira inquinata TaxID=2785627 RepID=A0A975SNJ1_9RHOO|nr:Nif11-like leader peptide family natural product precursor [Azospira inquinata]QWT45558.1 Nif11-like leader peptide family natural product precursor [Azospira inquinata]QWT49115.1 Nif11-like leader peptide family natural product precursor [Azospira inquinata]
MSVESAKAYIERMRADEPFRRTINDCEDEAANWAYLKEAGYDFDLQEFKEAQELIYQEYGITPM